MKKFPKTAFTNELGTNMIQRIALELGCMWYPTGGTEAGIDGTLELVNQQTGEATNQVITVQSKATADFRVETPEFVEFICKDRDIEYWMSGNTPIILVHSKPRNDEAYWISVKDYFSDPKARASRKVRFDKKRDRFDASCRPELDKLAVPKGSGLYLGTAPKQENLHSDLVLLRSFPSTYYTAPAVYSSRYEVIKILREERISLPGVWTIRNNILYSLDPLNDASWSDFCDQGCIEKHTEMGRLAFTAEPADRRLFVELLNLALKDQLYDQGLLFFKEQRYFYERPAPGLQEKETTYTSRYKRATRSTFKAYKLSEESTGSDYYRHAAFHARFMRFGSQWYLQIEPTYHFTSNGRDVSPLSASTLAGIKRLENNQAVHGQVIMWARRLQQQTSFEARPRKLFFGEPAKFSLDVGFEDSVWIKSDVVSVDEDSRDTE